MPRPALPAAFVAALLAAGPLAAQSRRPPSPRELDAQAQQLRDTFVRDAVALADGFAEAKQPEKAMALLDAVLRVAPDAPGVEQKVEALNESVLASGETTFDLPAGGGWVPAGRVFKGQPYRIAAAGEYRLQLNGDVGPAGLPPGDKTAGYLPDQPLGALLGSHVAAADLRGQRRPARGRDQGPDVFVLGDREGSERTPDDDGMLFLRLNVPEGAKLNGKLRVTVSGRILAGRVTGARLLPRNRKRNGYRLRLRGSVQHPPHGSATAGVR